MTIIRISLRLAAAVALVVTIASVASAAVYPPQRQLPAQVISDFKGSPQTLLQQFPNGGPQMILRVTDLGASDPTTLPGLIALLKDSATTKDQMKAIVGGLALVARMAAQTDQAYGTEIQTAIAGTQNADAIAAYQAATGDAAIAATGGGGAGGSGTGGATGTSGSANGGSSGTATTFGGTPRTNTAPSFSGSVASTGTSVSP